MFLPDTKNNKPNKINKTKNRNSESTINNKNNKSKHKKISKNKTMSRYNDRKNTLSTKEIGNLNYMIIDLVIGNNSISYATWSNSNPSKVVLLKGKINTYSINELQWDKVVSPIVEQVKSYLGKYPIKGQDIYLHNVKIGETTFIESSIGSLYTIEDTVLLPTLVKQLLEQKNIEQGF